MVDVILKDNTVAQASDVIELLIVSEVESLIRENDGTFDLTTTSGIEDASQLISDSIEITTGETVSYIAVSKQFLKQLVTV